DANPQGAHRHLDDPLVVERLTRSLVLAGREPEDDHGANAGGVGVCGALDERIDGQVVLPRHRRDLLLARAVPDEERLDQVGRGDARLTDEVPHPGGTAQTPHSGDRKRHASSVPPAWIPSCPAHREGVVLPRVDGQRSDFDQRVGSPAVDEPAGHDDEYSNEALRKLGARVSHLRRKRGMTQRDLSFDGCSYSYLARIEAGDRRPSPRVLMEIARRLGVSTEELTGETAPQQRPRSLELLDAMVLARMGRLEESEELLRGVLREAEVNGDGERMSEACEGLGVLAAERGDDHEARRLLEQALEVGTPPDPAQRVQLYGRLQEIYRRSGDVARALALLQDCIARLRRDGTLDDAKLVRYSLWLSEAYAEAGAFARSASALGEAQLVVARVQDGLGALERADTAYAAAIASLQRQPDSAPALARAYRHYGKFLKRLGRAEAALEAFELAADLAPSNQDALAPL